MKTITISLLMAAGAAECCAQSPASFRDVIKVPAANQFTIVATNLQDYVQGMMWADTSLLIDKNWRPTANSLNTALTVALADIPATLPLNTPRAAAPPGDCARFSWNINNCAMRLDALSAATVLTIRPVIQPGENLYDRIKQAVPACIREFDERIKFAGIVWPAVWTPGSFHQFGDLTNKARHWKERFEMEMLTDGLKIYLPALSHQKVVPLPGSWRLFENLRIDEQRPGRRAAFDSEPVE